MAKKRRMSKVSINPKLILDVAGAMLIVNKLPQLLQGILPLETPFVATLAGTGGGYLAGMLLKRPDLSNASIGVGIMYLASDMIDEIFTGVTGSAPVVSVSPSGVMTKQLVKVDKSMAVPPGVSDFVTLNEYVNAPGRATPFGSYQDVYKVN